MCNRIVITGIGLTAPGANNLKIFRENLLKGKSGVSTMNIEHLGKVPAGICDFDGLKYQTPKHLKTTTRAGSIGIYCANEALKDGNIDLKNFPSHRIGVYVGITEHGPIETYNATQALEKDADIDCFNPHYNPWVVANNPAGSISLNLNLQGPHYTLGGACASGNLSIIHAAQMLRLKECDMALAGGVSESIHSFHTFAGFRSQGALASHLDSQKACRPFDEARNGIVVSEGGCLVILERLEDAQKRDCPIYGELIGWHVNSDATSPTLPNPQRQATCIQETLKASML